MKKLIAAGAAAAIAAGALAVPTMGAPSATAAKAKKVKRVAVKDNRFGPKAITVRKGTKVRWVWKGKAPHNVRVVTGPRRFGSPIKTRGSFTKKLKRKGTYRLVCTIHPETMRMTIRVR
ncbi:MAG TPA: plastocyanin/azurin family copper-binding protein [Baekduia sp.]|nr:plastocyanin/azurin family copper-binding protein [Baekduia sp.]